MMLPRQTISALGVSFVAAILASACSDTDDTRPVGPFLTTSSSSSSSNSSSSGGQSSGGAGGDGGSAGMGGAGGGEGGASGLGAIPIIDIPDSSCDRVYGSIVELYPNGTTIPAFGMLTTVGTKRLAGGQFVPGFATFAMDGSSISPNIIGIDPDFDLVASEGSTIGLVAANGTSLRFARYGTNDTIIGNPITLANSLGLGVAIAGDTAGGSLVVWADEAIMRGRFIAAAGGADTPFTFADGLSTSVISTSLARATDDFVLAWSTIDGDIARTRFAHLNAAGAVGDIVDLTGSSAPHYVVKVITTSEGYALLIRAGLIAFDTVVVLLDANANPIGPARRFLGTKFPFDIAAQGTNLALLAKRADGSTEFRLIDLSGAPLGPWRCVDGPSTNTYDQAAVDANPGGWAIVYRTPDGGEKFVQTNLMGTASP